MAHDHSHDHAHTPAKFGTAFAIAAVLNIGIVVLEVTYGLLSNSTALLSDAAHNTGDVIGLLLAWGAYALAQRQPSAKFTYGLRSSTVLASLLNGMLLLVATGAIVWEAIRRFFEPTPVAVNEVIVVAVIAIIFNSLSAWLLSRGQKDDINIQSAFWHLVSDAAVSAGVVIAGFLIIWTGVAWIDSVASIGIAMVIIWSTWGLFREAVRLSLQAVPSSIDFEGVRKYLNQVAGVERVHDLHIWPISTTETALTCHFVVSNNFDSRIIARVSDEMEHKFKIGHTTIQLESADGKPCRLAPETTV